MNAGEAEAAAPLLPHPGTRTDSQEEKESLKANGSTIRRSQIILKTQFSVLEGAERTKHAPATREGRISQGTEQGSTSKLGVQGQNKYST